VVPVTKLFITWWNW